MVVVNGVWAFCRYLEACTAYELNEGIPIVLSRFSTLSRFLLLLKFTLTEMQNIEISIKGMMNECRRRSDLPWCWGKLVELHEKFKAIPECNSEKLRNTERYRFNGSFLNRIPQFGNWAYCMAQRKWAFFPPWAESLQVLDTYIRLWPYVPSN